MPAIQVEFSDQFIQDFCRKWNIRELALFGSVLRDDFRPDSDIDVLVTFAEEAHWSLWDIIAAQHELEELFGRKVDLVEKKCINNPFRRHAILTTKHVIYAA